MSTKNVQQVLNNVKKMCHRIDQNEQYNNQERSWNALL